MVLAAKVWSGLRAAFWRFAHSRYQSRRLGISLEMCAFTWFGLWAFVFGGGLLAGGLPDLPGVVIELALVGAPLTIGLLHRRIRVEAVKGPSALYLKRMATSGQATLR